MTTTLIKNTIGLIASALLATGFVAAATGPAYAAPTAIVQTV